MGYKTDAQSQREIEKEGMNRVGKEMKEERSLKKRK